MPNDYTQQPEADLLAVFAAEHSEAAFAELVKRHLPMVLGVCRRVLEDHHAAQDAAQAVFLALAKKAPALKREQALGGWLHHVALCTARNARTARLRRLRREQEAAMMQQNAAAEELKPETLESLREWLDRELDALPDKYRRPLVMVHLEGRTLEETALVLQCKDGTLRVWLNRAREKLRNRLLRRGVSVSVPSLVVWLTSQSESLAAAVPPELGSQTARDAMLWVTGGTAAAGLSAQIVALAKGVIHTMFISKLKTAAAITAAAAVVTTASALSWQKVYEARDKGLPKTAIEELKPIIVDALQNKRHAEAIKAICTKIAMEGNIEGNKAEEKIVRLQAEIEKATPEMKPLMEAVLANWYWQYFQQNRWRFIERTQTATAPGKDIQTWDLPRILAEIDKHFTAALADANTLKATPIAQFDDLLVKGSMPDTCRPTLYDFLAYEALEFYCAGEQGGAKEEDAFAITADSPIFEPADAFMRWNPEILSEPGPGGAGGSTRVIESPLLKAIRLYQELLLFHRDDADKTAFAEADLDRLVFGKNCAAGEDKDTRYKAALKQFVDTKAEYHVASRALCKWAMVVHEEGDPAEAHKLAQRGMDMHPKSVGATMCFNLIQIIESKSASIQTERVWNEPTPSITVTYQNVDHVYFRAIPYDFVSYIKSQQWGLYDFDDKQCKQLLGKKPVLEWNADLPPTKDFKPHTEKLPAPKTLKPGFYFIVASHNPSFREKNNKLSVVPVWVSDLALVIRQRNREGILEGFVLNANSGEPVAGAIMHTWEHDREGWLKPGPEAQTDANGLFAFSTKGTRSERLLVAEYNGQQLSTANEYSVRDSDPIEPESKTVFFTDRALYRPGQTIYYKGVSIKFDQNTGKYIVLGGLKLTVVFKDPNGKEITRVKHKTNDYGSFDGAFTAPRDRVMGEMSIQVVGRHRSRTTFNVEEYKRPKFQVELAAPKESARLNSEVTMTGKATAYTGSAIGGAKVSWRVVREVRFPPWCWWGCYRFGPRGQAAQNIAHGTAVTGNDGSFTVKFLAKPDPSVTEKEEPTFAFEVYADVTDTSGETRSDEQTIRVGFTALQAELTADEWQTPEKPVTFKIETTSLDDEPQKAEGKVKLYQLKQPATVVRAEVREQHSWWFPNQTEPKVDPSNPDSWELGDVVSEKSFATDDKGLAILALPTEVGVYRAMLETKDRFGKKVTARMTVQVLDPKATTYPVKVPNHFTAKSWSIEPGESLLALWGTGYDKGRAFVELACNGKTLRSYWTDGRKTQELIEQAVSEEMRGGLTLRVTYVRENRAYLNERIVDVPWSNKKLTVKWERFRSKLMPGQKETWTAVVTGPDSKGAVAEMVAGLYDASLDQYKPHDWVDTFGVFRRETDWVNMQFENAAMDFQHISGGWTVESRDASMTYRHFPDDLMGRARVLDKENDTQGGWFGGWFTRLRFTDAPDAPNAPMSANCPDVVGSPVAGGQPMEPKKADVAVFYSATKIAAFEDVTKTVSKSVLPSKPEPDLSKVAARKNLNETAFFLPRLMSDAEGVVKMEFTMPEALTEWQFLGFAHDKELRAGYLTDKTVTAKDLMVEPNPPRFVREGDVIEFTVKVSNQSAEQQKGKVRLTFANARTLKDVSSDLALRTSDISFDIPSKESKSFSWRLSIPDGCEFLTYKAVGSTGALSDGEEGFLPVLSRRILVTESLPLPIRGKQTKDFEFTKLLNSGKSDTLKHQSLTVQMVSQPAWYAVMALPYLMEYPHACSEQTFNRLYANALARHIANSDPKIRHIFDLWKGTPALDSPLEKNQDLKSVMLEETPWYRQAMSESQARKNVGILFDANRLNEETARTLQKLTEMQLNDGQWPWFPGGKPNEYITLYIVTGFGRLRHLGAAIDAAPAKRALTALDTWMDNHYRSILKQPHPENYVPSSTDALYLYGRSFFLKDQAVAKKHKEAVEFFLKQSRTFWLKTDCRQTQAHLAIALARMDLHEAALAGKEIDFGDDWTPKMIMKSLKERSVSNEEMGMFWRDTELSWWWYRAPIETQAMMIEAFAEVMGDTQAVDDCQTWLLKQKQTQDWKTTKATADAVYALLLRGSNKLASDALVAVALGGSWIKPENVEAGTGFYEERFTRGEIKPDMGKITVKKTDEGVSWGSVHWQYLENMTKITPHEGTPLKLKKTLWIKETTKKGPMLKPVTGSVTVGDEVVVRIELRTDRDMEYVHLKDQRGSGTEPVSVLSQYKYQDGLSYYESTRDTASHFFIDYLPKGVYVFEYSTRIQLKGKYQTGIAEIQCMYAPEFNSHSESFDLEVK